MPEALRSPTGGVADAVTQVCPPPIGRRAGERRRAERVRMPGAELFLFRGGDERFRLRVRDFCCDGLSGLSVAPLAVGETLLVQLEEMLMPAARVVWTRRALAGLKFTDPIAPARFKCLCERHESGAAWSPAMRAGSDLHSWWTDVQEQERRRPRLRSGGHKHPLPR